MSGPVLDYGTRERRRVPRWAIVSACVVVSAIIVAISLPSLGRSRYLMDRVKCGQMLRAVGGTLPMYAAEHRGAMPPDFAALFWDEAIPYIAAICPNSNDTPTAATQPAAIRADFAAGGHCSYVYVDGYAKYSTIPPDAVVAFEPLANHGDGANALFGDGHVEFVSKPAAAAIERQFKSGTRPVRVPAGTP